ncbi:MAG: SDR family NAD(P)-dependent oxidoreductase [Bacteroidales bacterium]|nr:SDR family NAD(P)-dependent oxidoreductase [Bacteroidales bacterium]
MKAIVMGASSGMGREVALMLLAEGWQVGVAARRAEALDELRAQFPQQVTTAVIDVTDCHADDLLTALIERMGGIDLYFHASGIGKQNPAVDADIELRTVATNAMGFTRLIDAAFRYMAEHGGGHIAAITSVAGTKGLGIAPSYSATKAFQNTYLQALEQLANMRHLPIRFTDIRPGFVATALLDDEHHYPMLMSVDHASKRIFKAVKRKKHIAIIDWRYRLLIAAWRRLPRALWRHLPIKTR